VRSPVPALPWDDPSLGAFVDHYSIGCLSVLNVGAWRHTAGVAIEHVLRRQAGVVSRSQALAEGMSSAAIGRLVSSGRWLRLHPRVYLAADHEYTAEAQLRGATLWAGPQATLSSVAAAWWHGLWQQPPSTVELTMPDSWKRAARPGTRVRRRRLHGTDRVEVRGLWVTSVPLTVLESMVELGSEGSTLLDRALQRRVDMGDLYRAHSRNAGRRGSAAAENLLRAAQDGAASEAERVAIGLLRDAGLSGWVRGYQVGGYELDLAFPNGRIAIEVDGWAWHSDVERFRGDRRRQNALVLAGWTVLRFTWHDLCHRPAEVVGQIAKLVGVGAHM
jgi:very-short-patch-repair endonuclease